MIDYVLKLDDNLERDFRRLMQAFSLDHVELEKLNALGATARGSEKSSLQVKNLDRDTLACIHELYAKDFADLGYSRRLGDDINP